METTAIYKEALLEIVWLSEPDSDIADIASEVLLETGALRTENENQLNLFTN